MNKARDPSVSGRVAAWAEEAGLRAVRQEEISWGAGRWLTDCISLIVKTRLALGRRTGALAEPRVRARSPVAVARLVRYL